MSNLSWSLPLSTHEPYVKFSLLFPAVEGSEWVSGFHWCLASDQCQTTTGDRHFSPGPVNLRACQLTTASSTRLCMCPQNAAALMGISWTLQAYLEQRNYSPLQLYLIPCWSPGDYHLCHFNLLSLKTHSEAWSFPHPTAFSNSLVIITLLIPQHSHEISDSFHSPPSAWSSCSDSSQTDHDVWKERVRLLHK